LTGREMTMADEKRSAPTSLFEAVRPNLEAAPLIVSSDVLVIMLRIVGALRALLLIPAIESSSASHEVKATALDIECRIAALIRAIDELAETQGQKRNER
jgi:hypothetical protein